jgi:hypothetical protein
MEITLLAFITAQTVLLPIMGLLYLGIRAERIKKEILYKKAITTISYMSYRTRR